MKERVENCVADICRWMDVNELKLNRDKTDIMLIHSKYRISPPLECLDIGSERVSTIDSVISLGVVLMNICALMVM